MKSVADQVADDATLLHTLEPVVILQDRGEFLLVRTKEQGVIRYLSDNFWLRGVHLQLDQGQVPAFILRDEIDAAAGCDSLP